MSHRQNMASKLYKGYGEARGGAEEQTAASANSICAASQKSLTTIQEFP